MLNVFGAGLRRAAGFTVLLVTLANCGTAEEDKNLTEVRSVVAQCKDKLENADYLEARKLGERVINTPRLASVNDVEVDRARFCYTTANSLLQLNELTKNLQSLLQAVLGLVGGEKTSLSPQQIQRLALAYGDGRLDPKVQSAISILFGSFSGPIENTLKENQAQMEEIIRHKRFSWSLQHLPIKIGDASIADAKGAYDMGEIDMLYGLNRQVLGVFGLFKSQDYSISLKPLTDYIINVKPNPVLNLSAAPGIAISNLVAVLMGSSPNFLSLDSAVGAGAMKNAGENFARGFGATLDSLSFIKNRKGDQSAHVLEFRKKDDKDYLILHMAINNGANPIPVVDLQKFDGIAIPLDAKVLEGLKNMSDDFANTPGVNTNLQRDVFPIVTLALVVLAGSGAFDALIQMALEGTSDKVKATANDLIKLLTDNQDLVLAALVSLVPVEIEFDFGHMFSDPGGLREVFPAWTQPADLSASEPFTQATLVYSYDCDDKSDPLRDGVYFCPTVSLGSDKDHFQKLDGSAYRMWDPATHATYVSVLKWKNYSGTGNFGPAWDVNAPAVADGIASKFPYIGFKDPTFAKVVYLNVEAINMVNGKKGMLPATLTTLNATFATIVATVQGFL